MTENNGGLPTTNPFRTRREQRMAETFVKAMSTGIPKVMPTISSSTPEELQAAKVQHGNGMTIDDLLRRVVLDGASDLHLSCDSYPRYRVDGDLIDIPDTQMIDDNWLKVQMQLIVPPTIWERFLEDGEADLSYALKDEQRDWGRFRVNVFKQRGTTASVLRTIPTKIKTIAELGVPDSLNHLIKRKKGLILVTGPTGSGKALRLDTKIPTPNGFTTMGELNIGDTVIDSQGNPTTVTGMSDINDSPTLFKVKLSDGQKVYADKDHQWIVSTFVHRNLPRHWKTIQTEKNSKNGLAASDKLIALSEKNNIEHMRLSELMNVVEKNDLTMYFPSVGSIRASLGFMDVALEGGNGRIPLTFNASDALFALGARLKQRYERETKSMFKVMSTLELVEQGLKDKFGRAEFAIPVASLNGVEKELTIDPYILGVWLGDGNSSDGRIASGYQDLENMLENIQERWTGDVVSNNHENCAMISFHPRENDGKTLNNLLKIANLRKNKHIPAEYFTASREQRLSLLQGLMDTDGTISKNGQSMEIGISDKRLAEDCLRLVRSLGIKATMTVRSTGYKNKEGIRVEGKTGYRVKFTTTQEVSKLKRKAERLPKKNGEGQKWIYITEIEEIPVDSPEYGSVRCISVDSPDHSYLCADYVVTHNTTTLTAMLDAINETRREHIVTIEDPIEFVHTNKKSLVNQREVGTDTLSFAEALKRVLRQDPDVILIGELRDAETISTALTASETGHLVFGTLHTQSAVKTIDRIIDTFPPAQQGQVRSQLSDTLQAVVAQSLVKKIGGGRVAATEIMLRTDAIANQIREGKVSTINNDISTGRSQGMHTMDQDLIRLVKEGLVDRDEAAPLMLSPASLEGLVAKTNEWDF